jgi:hypothetical protein
MQDRHRVLAIRRADNPASTANRSIHLLARQHHWGEFSDATVIRKFGDVRDDLSAFVGPTDASFFVRGGQFPKQWLFRPISIAAAS